MPYTDLRVKKIKTLAYYKALKEFKTTFKNKAGIYLLYQGLLDKIEWKLSEKEPMKADILRDIDQIMATSLQAENNETLQDDIDFKVLERGIRIQLQNYLMHADLLDFQDMNLPKDNTCIQAIGYKEFFPYFDGKSSLEECIENLKKSTRNYAKRQITWFKNKLKPYFLNGNSTREEMIETIIKNVD